MLTQQQVKTHLGKLQAIRETIDRMPREASGENIDHLADAIEALAAIVEAVVIEAGQAVEVRGPERPAVYLAGVEAALRRVEPDALD